MKSVKCSAVGAGSSQNKTLPRRERNEESCENRGRVIGIPVVVEPVVVPVPPAAVPVEVKDVAVAVWVAKNYIGRLPHHHSLNALGVESYLASKMP